MNRTLLALAGLLLLAIPSGMANLPIASTPPACGPSDLSVIADGQVLPFSTDFTLENPCGILVEGALVGTAGASIHLRSDGPVLLLGSLVAGDGDAVHRDGGSILIEAGVAETCVGSLCSATSLFIGPSAIVQAGNGAPGASGAFDTDCRCVQGGPGGAGGNIRLIAHHGEAVNSGHVQPGAGGNGGDAQALGIEPVAVGGAGGAAGNAILASADHATASILEAPAGNGGNALATTMTDPLSDPVGYATGILKGADGNPDNQPCEANALLALLPDALPLGGGSNDGGNQSANGGNGSAGPYEGGNGGGATANGCNHTEPANNGTDGDDASQTCVGPDPEPGGDCPPGETYGDGANGAAGATGAHGGDGTAVGGDGGPGLLVGGAGGSARATGGQGGQGGRGGDGGDGMQGAACTHGGDGGAGGTGGSGGRSVARGGNGGDASVPSPVGQGGPGGDADGAPGAGGNGGDGGKGGKGSYPLGGSIGAGGGSFDIGCTAPDGKDGSHGATGTVGQPAWTRGENGHAGNGSLNDWLKGESGIDVDGTVTDCTTITSGSPSPGACHDAYFALFSLVAAITRTVDSCGLGLQTPDFDGGGDSDGGPIQSGVDCGALLDALWEAEAGAEQGVLDAVASARQGALDTVNAVTRDVGRCTSGIDPTCKTILDTEAHCLHDLESGGTTPCDAVHDAVLAAKGDANELLNQVLALAGVVTQCASGHDPINTNACSLANACIQNPVACSGAQNILGGVCGSDQTTDCTNAVGELAGSIVPIVIGLAEEGCGANFSICIGLVAGLLLPIVVMVQQLVPTNVGACDGPDDCQGVVMETVFVVVDLIGGACNKDSTQSASSDGDCVDMVLGPGMSVVSTVTKILQPYLKVGIDLQRLTN